MVLDFRCDLGWVDDSDGVQEVCSGDDEVLMIFSRFSDLDEPKQRRELAKRAPSNEVVCRNDVVDVEHARLYDRLELFPDEGVRILHDVLRANRINGQPVCIRSLKAKQVRLLLLRGPTGV